MANETKTVTTDFCEACRADVRPDSLFCYNCGGSLAKAPDSLDSMEGSNIEDGGLNGSNSSAPVIKEGPGLPSAATIRKQSSTLRRKPVQITWDPVEETSDVTLLLVAVGLLVFAIMVVGIAVYFK